MVSEIDIPNEALITYASDLAYKERNKIQDIEETRGIIKQLELMLMYGDVMFDSETIFIEMMSQTRKFNRLIRLDPKIHHSFKK